MSKRESIWGRPSLDDVAYARQLAIRLGVKKRYRWVAQYWTKDELDELVRGFERRLGYLP